MHRRLLDLILLAATLLLCLPDSASTLRVRSLWLDLRSSATTTSPLDPYASMLQLYGAVSANPLMPRLQGPAISKVLVPANGPALADCDAEVSKMLVRHDDATDDLFIVDGDRGQGRVLTDPNVADVNACVRYAFRWILLQGSNVDASSAAYALRQAEHCSSISGDSRRSFVCVCVNSEPQLRRLIEDLSSESDAFREERAAAGLVVALPPDPEMWILALSSWAASLESGIVVEQAERSSSE